MEEEIEVSKKITEEDIEKFAEISEDRNPIHMEEDFAAKTLFGDRIAHGLISASIISRGLTEMMGPGNIWLSQDLDFKNPVYIGDKITATLRLKDERKGVKTIKTICRNQDGEKVIDGEAEVKKLPEVD